MQAGQPSGGAAATPAWRSPIALVTAAALVVALVVIVVVALKPFSGGATPTASGALPLGLVRPTESIPSTIARDGRTLGSPTAKVVLEEWEDYQCPACGQFSTAVEPELIRRFVTTGGLRLTFHDFTFIGQESFDAATATRCANDQGKFWEYHAWVFANQNGENQGWFSRERLAAMADQVGLDKTAWGACYDGGTMLAEIKAETATGQAAGVTSTPTLFLDGKKVTVNTYAELYSQIQAAIDAASGATSSAAPPTATP